LAHRRVRVAANPGYRASGTSAAAMATIVRLLRSSVRVFETQ
jgi:hypothetical protein